MHCSTSRAESNQLHGPAVCDSACCCACMFRDAHSPHQCCIPDSVVPQSAAGVLLSTPFPVPCGRAEQDEAAAVARGTPGRSADCVSIAKSGLRSGTHCFHTPSAPGRNLAHLGLVSSSHYHHAGVSVALYFDFDNVPCSSAVRGLCCGSNPNHEGAAAGAAAQGGGQARQGGHVFRRRL